MGDPRSLETGSSEQSDSDRDRDGDRQDAQRPPGRTPLAAPNARSTASQIERAAPIEAQTPPVVHSRPSPRSTRAKSANRTALPTFAGTKVFTSDPTP